MFVRFARGARKGKFEFFDVLHFLIFEEAKPGEVSDFRADERRATDVEVGGDRTDAE